jgi:hypothetical protein
VTATVTNNSGYTIDVSRPKAFDSRGLWTDKSAGFGVAVFVPPRPNTTDVGGYLVHPARTARPALPTRLAAHATWTGTFSASDRLPRKSDMRVSFGLFTVAAAPAADAAFVGQAFDWVTDHSFRRAS